MTGRLSRVRSQLERGGFLSAEDEAALLAAAARGDGDRLEGLLRRRLTGEPLAWIVGRTTFCGIEVRIEPGVYVPRPQTEALARRAAARLPVRGVAIDICTGSGAVAKALLAMQPTARVVGVDIEPRAVACAASNGVEAYCGDLFDAAPPELAGRADVVVAVVPYVPTHALALLQRDTFTFESPLAYDGGLDGADVLRRVIHESVRFLKPGGALLIELGGVQAELIKPELARAGFGNVVVLRDEDDDIRGVEATLHDNAAR